MPTVEDVAFDKLRETLILLQHVASEFKTYSAADIRALIKAALKSKGTPTALRHLYELEEMIAQLREIIEAGREKSVFTES
jgi:hypothetical protein